MSPAPLTDEAQLDPHLDQLQAVGKAFDALLLTLYRLTHRHNDLKQHTEEVFRQVNSPFSPLVSCTLSPISNDEKFLISSRSVVTFCGGDGLTCII